MKEQSIKAMQNLLTNDFVVWITHILLNRGKLNRGNIETMSVQTFQNFSKPKQKLIYF